MRFMDVFLSKNIVYRISEFKSEFALKFCLIDMRLKKEDSSHRACPLRYRETRQMYRFLGLYLEIEDVSKPSEKPCDAFK